MRGRGRVTFVLFLLFAANAQKYFWVLGEFDDDISEMENDENQIENDQYKQVLQIKSTMNQILQDNYKTASRLKKLEKSQNKTNYKVERYGKELKQQKVYISGKMEKALGQSQIKSNGRIDEANSKTSKLEKKLKKVEQEQMKINPLYDLMKRSDKELKQQMLTIAGKMEKLGKSQIQSNGRIDEINTKTKSMTYKLSKLEHSQNQANGRIHDMNIKTSGIANKLGKIEETLILKKKQEKSNAIIIRPECVKLRKLVPDVSKRNLFSAVGKHFYFNPKKPVTWYEARDFCAAKGMKLATLKTNSELGAVAKELKHRDHTWHYFWLYATDKGRWPGHFYWADGSSLDRTLWGKGDPNAAAFGKATCVWLAVSQAKVFDDHCTHLRNILCEAPAPLQSCVN